jgi:hypothetical protein
VLLQTPFAWPEIVVCPGQSGHPVQDLVLGRRDIDLESNEFNQRYLVRCADRKFAYDVLHQQAMRFLLDHAGLCVEGRGFHVLVYRGQAEVPREVLALLNAAYEFMDLVPEYVIHERTGPAAMYRQDH